MKKVIFIGAGPGGASYMTSRGWEALEEAQVILAPQRLVDSLFTGQGEAAGPKARNWAEVWAQKGEVTPTRVPAMVDQVRRALDNLPEDGILAYLCTGDLSYFSIFSYLHRTLAESLTQGVDYEEETVPGISAVSYFCSHLAIKQDRCAILSLHGDGKGLVGDLAETPLGAFVLAAVENPLAAQKAILHLDAKHHPMAIYQALRGFSAFRPEAWTWTLGRNLSLPQEEIRPLTIQELEEADPQDLKVWEDPALLLLSHQGAQGAQLAQGTQLSQGAELGDLDAGETGLLVHSNLDLEGPGLPDSYFERAKVPMTKREIRTLILNHLKLPATGVFYDIGTGTGSIACEMGAFWPGAQVYAWECVPEAQDLARTNIRRFGLSNVTLRAAEFTADWTETEGAASTEAQEADSTTGTTAASTTGTATASTTASTAGQGTHFLPPAPDRVFIGGSRGHLAGILDRVEALAAGTGKTLRLGLSAIILETATQGLAALEDRGWQIARAAQIQVNPLTAIGKERPLHMLRAENPIFLIFADRTFPAPAGEESQQAELAGERPAESPGERPAESTTEPILRSPSSPSSPLSLTLLGLGLGAPKQLTLEGLEAIRQARNITVIIPKERPPMSEEAWALRPPLFVGSAGLCADPRLSVADQKAQVGALAASTEWKIIHSFVVPGQKLWPVYYPMKTKTLAERKERREAEAAWLWPILQKERHFLLPCLGDPAFYSSVAYLRDYLLKLAKKEGEDLVCRQLPGISSLTAIPNALGAVGATGRESYLVLGGAKSKEELAEALRHSPNVLLMKAGKAGPLIEALQAEKAFPGLEVQAVSNLGLEGECLTRTWEDLPEGDLPYFTTMLLKWQPEEASPEE